MRSHDWIGPNGVIRHVHCANCGKIFEINKPKGLCPSREVDEMISRKVAVKNGMAMPIPISAARKIADTYGYDQVVIVARKVGNDGGEHVTTYGIDAANCEVAARTGDFLKYKIMGWRNDTGF